MEVGFIDRVWVKLIEIPIGSVYDITKKVKPENREDFKDAARMFIDFDYGNQYGFYCQFSNDYHTINKIAI